MTAVTIRQSGGADIVTIPKAVGKAMGLHVGTRLELDIVDNKIVLTPINEEESLESLLAASPKSAFHVSDEDQQWLNDTPKGQEL